MREITIATGYLQSKRPAEALSTIALFLQQNPTDIEALCIMIEAQLDLGQIGDAYRTSRHAVECAPGAEWAWRLLSVASARVGASAESRAAARAALDIAPGLWQTHALTALADMWTGAIAKDTFRKAQNAIEIAPDIPDTFVVYGTIALAQDRFKLAEKAFVAALQRDPTHEEARILLVRAQLRRGNIGDSVASALGLIASAPQENRIFASLGLAASLTLNRVNAVIILTGFALFVICHFGTVGSPGTDLPETARVIVCAAVLASCAGSFVFFLLFRRKIGSQFGAFVRSIPRLSKRLAVTAVLQVISFLGLVSVALASAMGWSLDLMTVLMFSAFLPACLALALVTGTRRWN